MSRTSLESPRPSPASPDAAPTIVVDAVFFQYFQTGIARVWRSLLAQWAGSEFGGRLCVLDRAGTAPRIDGLRYLDLPRHDLSDLPAERRMLQQVCDEERAALFISSGHSAPERTATVFMAHDMIPELLWPQALAHPMWLEKHAAIRQARHIVAVSHNTARDLCRLFPEVPAARVTVAHCGVGFRPPTPARIAAFRKAHGVSRPYFLVVGARGDYKNTIAFFRAFEMLGAQRSQLAIVCTGPGAQLDAAYQPFVGPAQVYPLQLDDADLQAAYGGALALVYPSLYEGFGMPVIEAMACACPVVASGAGSLAEVAGDAALRVAPTDHAGLAAAMRAIVQQPALRKRLRAAGLQRAAGFSWRRMADAVRDVLEREAAAAPAAAPGQFDAVDALGAFHAAHRQGLAQLQRGDLAQAEHFLRLAVALHERSAKAQYDLGLVQLAAGRGLEAWACFQRALAADPVFAPALERVAELTRLLSSATMPSTASTASTAMVDSPAAAPAAAPALSPSAA
jgi:glycosyltransferase involved in cell wall biosynthesis